MGNSFSKICGFPTAGDKSYQMEFGYRSLTETKTNDKRIEEDTPREGSDKVVKIQTQLRQYSARKKYNNLIIEKNEKEFEENLTKIGTPITEEEINSKISEKVKALEQTISAFKPSKDELKLYKETFIKGPIQLEDGSVYKGSWNSINTRMGYGVLINPQGFKYEGFWTNEKLNGRGRFIDDKGNYYEGEWKDGMANGKGVIITPNVKYVGDWTDDFQNGYGEEFFFDGDYYQGHFKNGVKHGKGKFFWKDGSSYEGEFVNSTISGKGIFKWSDGRSYEGEWKNNKMDGQGTYTWPEGKKYFGDYRKEKKEGFGTYYFSDDKYYQGEWLDNKQHGQGIYYLKGNTYKVQYRFGKLINKVFVENKREDHDKSHTIDQDNMIASPPPLQNDHGNHNFHIDATAPIMEQAINGNHYHLNKKDEKI